MEVILGDNPFFGVNHISQSKAAGYYSREDKYNNAANVIACAVSAGVKTLMVSTHADLPNLLSAYSSKNGNSKNLNLALVLPYAQKLNTIVGEKGLAGLAAQMLKPSDFLGLISDAYGFFVKKDIPKNMAKVFLDQEFSLAEGMPIKYVCVQNIVTDLLLSFRSKMLIEDFIAAFRSAINAELVFITQNALLLDELTPKSITSCFTYNANGFMVNPGLREVREYVSSTDRSLWAMGVFASGQLSQEEVLADEYLKHFEAVLYATSNQDRIKQALPGFLSI